MSNLTFEQKEHVKSILQYGLNINPNLNFSYFLNAIRDTNLKVQELESKLNSIISNQQILDQKLNKIINMLNK